MVYAGAAKIVMRRPVASIPSKRIDVSYYHYYVGPSTSYLNENGHAQEALSAKGLNPGQFAAFAVLSSVVQKSKC